MIGGVGLDSVTLSLVQGPAGASEAPSQLGQKTGANFERWR